MPKVAVRNPLSAEYFKDFESCYNQQRRKGAERFRRFTREEIETRNDNLDIFWLKEESTKLEGVGEPEELIGEAIAQVETATDALNEIAFILANDRRGNGRG